MDGDKCVLFSDAYMMVRVVGRTAGAWLMDLRTQAAQKNLIQEERYLIGFNVSIFVDNHLLKNNIIADSTSTWRLQRLEQLEDWKLQVSIRSIFSATFLVVRRQTL